MFKRPEELIVLVLALCWVGLTYFAAAAFTGDTYTTLLISGLTLAWALVCFALWQRNLSRLIWPLFIGTLVACWWPLLDWFAFKDYADSTQEALAIDAPWYTGWTFKLILAIVPTLFAFYWRWQRARRRRLAEAANFSSR